MRFYCVFCTILTFMRWKICCVELQSDSFSSGTIINEPPVIVRVTENSAELLTDSPVSIESFGLERGLTENSAQPELSTRLSESSIASNVVIRSSTVTLDTGPLDFVPIQNINSEMFVNKFIKHATHSKALLTSSSQLVPSELNATSLAEDNLTPEANPISARMLNTSPDVIMTSPIKSMKNFDKQLEILATPTTASTRIESSNASRSLESNVFPEHDIAKILNSTRPSLQANGTKSVKVEKRTNSHTMVIVPAVIGVISVLFVGFMAALYQWHQRGRRRKVYLSHPGAPPKDFAEDTGVRSPVLLPEEIEMQVGRSQSLRVRRAVILATDPPVIEADSITVNVDNVTSVAVSDDPVTNLNPPPPPYREPPPYLPDMVIENIHAL